MGVIVIRAVCDFVVLRHGRSVRHLDLFTVVWQSPLLALMHLRWLRMRMLISRPQSRTKQKLS